MSTALSPRVIVIVHWSVIPRGGVSFAAGCCQVETLNPSGAFVVIAHIRPYHLPYKIFCYPELVLWYWLLLSKV